MLTALAGYRLGGTSLRTVALGNCGERRVGGFAGGEA